MLLICRNRVCVTQPNCTLLNLVNPDASNIAVRCCLIQWNEGKQEKPIAFASCKLTATQSTMSTIEREAFAEV